MHCVTEVAGGFAAGFSLHLIFDVILGVGLFLLGRTSLSCFPFRKHKHSDCNKEEIHQ